MRISLYLSCYIKSIKNSILSIVLLIITAQGTANAQGFTDFSRLVPPSPEAASLLKITKVPVDHSTGVASISIPLYEVRTGTVSIPISLNYHASGIKVDQLASSVGLGWGLSAGGAVQRTVRGQPDDGAGGSFELDITDSYINDMNDNMTVYDNDYLLSGRDFTQDDYSYNFLGFSNSFYFDVSKTIRQALKEPVKLERIQLPMQEPFFEARDFNGNIYYFKQADRSGVRNYKTNSPLSQYIYDHISSWKLTRIQHQGIDTVGLQYEDYSISYQVQTTDIFDRKKQKVADVPGAPCDPTCPTCGDDYDDNMYHQVSEYSYDNSLIKQIQTRNSRVDFYYADHSGATVWKRKLDSVIVRSMPDSIVRHRIYLMYELFNGNNQLKLIAVKKLDVSTGIAEETKLEYYENPSYPLPGLSSRSRDMFGYFNGAFNQFLITSTDSDYPYTDANRDINPNMIMLGSLKKMTYPTGGYSEFIYEPNQVSANTFGEGIRIKQINQYDGINSPTQTAYEYFGYLGRTVIYPVNMSPEIQEATYRRKIFSSSGMSNSSLVPLTSLIPVGYMYDSVVEHVKGVEHDLITSYKYRAFIVNNSNKPYLEKASYYRYVAGTGSYEKVRSDISKYSYSAITDNMAPLADVIPSMLMLAASFYPGGTLWTCKAATPGLFSTPMYEYLIQKMVDSSITYTAANNMSNSTRYYYNTMPHLQPVRIVAMNSTDSTITTIKYPAEMVADGLDNTGVYQQMLTSYLWARKVIEESFNAQSDHLSKTITGYSNWGHGVALSKLEIGLKGATPEKRKEIKAYDIFGNVQQYEEDGFSHTLLWEHQGTVPVAHIINGVSDETAYTSFETGVTGFWNASGGSNATVAVTGNKGYTLGAGNSITRTGLPTKNYIVSYWLQNGGSITVNGATGIAGISKNGWTFYQHTLASVTSVSIAGNGTIDELRLYPEKAQMITYTYEPLVGMTSQCDANNNIAYYEYDGLNRLLRIRDRDKNILKQFDYQYQVVAHANPVWQATGATRCKPCSANENYTDNIVQHEEHDTNPNSSTYGQTRWVDGTSSSACAMAGWQNTATPTRCKTSNGENTGEIEQEQRDMNPCSPTYNQTQWVVVEQNCNICSKPPNWQPTGVTRCAKDANDNNTGSIEREEKDLQVCSPTWNQSRWIPEAISCEQCPTPANWQPTGNVRCATGSGNNNTGYQEIEEQDISNCSPTLGQLRWVAGSYNPTACPVCTGCKPPMSRCYNNACKLGTIVYTASVYNSSTGMYDCTYHYEWPDGFWSIDYTVESTSPCL